jgi:hypothetical protein
MESKKNNRITLFIIALVVFVLVIQSIALAQPPGSRGGRGGGDIPGGGDMFGGGGRGGDRGDRGDIFGGGGRGGPGRGGMPFQEENVTDAQIERIIKLYSTRHSSQETTTLQEQRKNMNREQFIPTLRVTAWIEWMEVMREEREYREILEWCEKFTPDEVKGTSELKDENFDLYKKRLDSLRNKYRSLIGTRRGTSDELMQVLVSDLQLELKERDLTMQYWTATDQGKKESISADLKDVVSQRYDLIVKQKEIQYTDFQKRLKSLQDNIDAQLKDINTWKDPELKAKEVINQRDRLINAPTMFRRGPFGPPQSQWGLRNNSMPGANMNLEPNSIPEPNK